MRHARLAVAIRVECVERAGGPGRFRLELHDSNSKNSQIKFTQPSYLVMGNKAVCLEMREGEARVVEREVLVFYPGVYNLHNLTVVDGEGAKVEVENARDEFLVSVESA